MKNIFVYQFFGLIFILFLSACGNRVKTKHVSDIDVTEEISVGSEKTYHPSPEFGTIQLEVNPAVKKWINYFQGRGRRHMSRYLKRSARYMPMMKSILRQRGMPEELVYVPLIESGFNAKAHSSASAVGYWQFIRPTGKRYGLKINGYLDERRDPVLSTQAAASYYAALYNLFGDWYLALASYNTGENRVKRAVMKTRTRDFWQLAKRKRLPRETRNYVPKFIAAALIHQNPAKYGFHNVDYQKPMTFDEVEVSRSISLLSLSKNLKIPYKSMQKLNPMYRSDYVPVKKGSTVKVRIPEGYQDTIIAAVSSSYSSAPKVNFSKGYIRYKVRRGDTLSQIAQRHRSSVRSIRSANNLGRRSFIRIGQRLRIPERGGVRVAKRSTKRRASSKRKPAVSSKVHVVRNGENLSTIARKHRITVAKLRKLNNLGRRSLIKKGQVLVVRTKGKVHVVRRGENLSVIAKRYGTTVRTIAQANSLGRRSRIYAGKTLVIPQ